MSKKLAEVLERQCEELARGDIPDHVRYFYELAIRHEDMHVEALTYMRQTLAYPPPAGLGEPVSKPAGPLSGDLQRLISRLASWPLDNTVQTTPLLSTSMPRGAKPDCDVFGLLNGTS